MSKAGIHRRTTTKCMPYLVRTFGIRGGPPPLDGTCRPCYYSAGGTTMREQIAVIYENGVFRPLTAVPLPLREQQHLNVTIEMPNGTADWLADADPSVSLETVRQALGKMSG